MKTLLRIVALVLSAVVGLWALVHGITLAVALRAHSAGHEDLSRHLIEGSVCIAGGICVLSVAAQQLYCWRTHRKDGGLL